MKNETVPEYKKMIVALAIAGGAGVTLAGAGLLIYRYWNQRRSRGTDDQRGRAETDVKELAETSKPARGEQEHGSKAQNETPGSAQSATEPVSPTGRWKTSMVIHPSAVQTPITCPAASTVTVDSLSTSGTFEKLPAPGPESFEQLSMSQVQDLPSGSPETATPTPVPISSPTKVPIPRGQATKSEVRSPTKPVVPSKPQRAVDTRAAGHHVTMKEKNDIVLVDSNPTESQGSPATGKSPTSDTRAGRATATAAAAASAESPRSQSSAIESSPSASGDAESSRPGSRF